MFFKVGSMHSLQCCIVNNLQFHLHLHTHHIVPDTNQNWWPISIHLTWWPIFWRVPGGLRIRNRHFRSRSRMPISWLIGVMALRNGTLCTKQTEFVLLQWFKGQQEPLNLLRILYRNDVTSNFTKDWWRLYQQLYCKNITIYIKLSSQRCPFKAPESQWAGFVTFSHLDISVARPVWSVYLSVSKTFRLPTIWIWCTISHVMSH